MVNKNIQMKKREGNDWDNLFPITLTENVYSKVGVSVESDIERLDQKDENLTAQLNQRGIDIKQFGVVGDGITDDTEAIQEAMDSPYPIFWGDGEYLFERFEITNSDKKVIFSENVVLKSYLEEDEPTNRGCVSVWGNETNIVKNATSNIKANTRVINVNNTTGLNEGDLVVIRQTDPSGNSFEDSLQKYLVCVVKIKEVYASQIEFVETVPHSYNLENNPTIRKIDPASNVELIGSNTLIDNMGATTYKNHIVIGFSENVKVSGFKTENGGGKGVVIRSSYNTHVSNHTHSKPTNISAGHGYGIQLTGGSMHATIEKVRVYDSRHAVDFAGGISHVLFKEVYGFGSDFSGHGMNSKYITFESCHAFNTSFQIGNNTFQADSHCSFIDCHVYDAPIGFGITMGSYDARIINCTTTNVVTPITVNGGGKNVVVDGLVAVGVSDNGVQLNTNTENVTITNSIFILNNQSGGTCRGIWSRENVKDVSISNVKISTADDMIESSYTRGIMVEGSSNITVENVEISGKLHEGVVVNSSSGDVSFNHLTVTAGANRTLNVRGSEILLTNSRISGVNMLVQPSVLLMTSNIFSHSGAEVYPANSATVVVENNLFLG